MRAGLLRHRVLLRLPQEVRDDFGGVVYSWANGDTVWAAVEPLQGREYMEARQIQSEITTRIRMRWRDDVTQAMRVVWVDPASVRHEYEIVSVQADPTHQREIVLMCKEAS